MKALYLNDFGTTDVLQYGERPTPVITDQNEVLVETRAVGLNYADIYRRKGHYPISGKAPYILGYEGAGIVVEKGANVSDYNIGDRICFADAANANAEYVKMDKDRLIPIPDDLSFTLAASIILQGLTADFLFHDLGRNQRGDTAFVHGISGGVGQILSQMLTINGIRVIGLTSSEEKKSIALQQGAAEIYLRSQNWVEDLEKRNIQIDTVYDGVGTTLKDSIKAVKKRGTVVFYGMAAGDPEPVDMILLLLNSKSIVTGDLWDYLTSQEERSKRSQRLFRYFQAEDGIQLTRASRFSLKDGKKAHERLESGRNIGKIILEPDFS